MQVTRETAEAFVRPSSSCLGYFIELVSGLERQGKRLTAWDAGFREATPLWKNVCNKLAAF